MTESEAIEELETSRNLAKMCTQNSERKREIESYEMAIKALKEIQACRAIGTIEEFKALKEKATPKKGIPYTSSNNHKFVECPSCHKDMDLYYDFCQYCGQSVDWGKSKT